MFAGEIALSSENVPDRNIFEIASLTQRRISEIMLKQTIGQFRTFADVLTPGRL